MMGPITVSAPLFVNHNHIKDLKGNISLILCTAMDIIVPGKAICAQRMGDYWDLFVSDDDSRDALLVSGGLSINNTLITIYDSMPNENKKQFYIPNERIVFKNVPFYTDNSELIAYLSEHKQIILRSDIHCAQNREGSDLTPFYNGDRYIYVKGLFTPPLPKNASYNGMRFRIRHSTQDGDQCGRCKSRDHKTSETVKCPHYKQIHQQDMVAFNAKTDPLCNFYICKFTLESIKNDMPVVSSVEKAYQYIKCKTVNYNILGAQILNTADPSEIKRLSKTIPDNVLGAHDWHKKKLQIMMSILQAKMKGCAEFRERLFTTGHSPIIEANSDLYWASGLDYNTTKTTLIDHHPGQNHLGKLLASLRGEMLVGVAMYDQSTSSYSSTHPPQSQSGSATSVSNQHEDSGKDGKMQTDNTENGMDQTSAPPGDMTSEPIGDISNAPPNNTSSAPPADNSNASPCDISNAPQGDISDAPHGATSNAPPYDISSAPPSGNPSTPSHLEIRSDPPSRNSSRGRPRGSGSDTARDRSLSRTKRTGNTKMSKHTSLHAKALDAIWIKQQSTQPNSKKTLEMKLKDISGEQNGQINVLKITSGHKEAAQSTADLKPG